MKKKPKLTVVETGLPYWLLPKRMNPDAPLTDADLEFIFDEMIKGHTLTSILRDHPGLPDYAKLMRYIMSTSTLEARYYEMKRIQTNSYDDEIVDTARGVIDNDSGIPEDLERAKVKINTLKWLMSVNNRKRYGDSKEINIKGQIDMRAAMERGDQRLIETGVTIEHED